MLKMQEKEIIEAIGIAGMHNKKAEVGARKFIAKQIYPNKWVVEFTYRNSDGYKLFTRRGAVREFLRLSGVQKWMQKAGAKEFTVIL